MPRPMLQVTNGNANRNKQDPCSCTDVLKRRNRHTVSNWPLDFRVVIYTEDALTDYYLNFGSFAVTYSDRLLSKADQVELLNQLKLYCECDSDAAQGGLIHLPKSDRGNSDAVHSGVVSTTGDKRLCEDEDVYRENKKHKSNNKWPSSFHHVFRISPFALHLNMKFTLPAAQHRAIDRNICGLLKANVTGTPRGRIYIAQRPSASGYIKIGHTESDFAAKRLLEQRQLCYNDDMVLLKETTEIPWAQRVEQIIFKELALYRRNHDCGKCGQQHTEWFEISVAKAETVIKRWANWSLRHPYDQRKKLRAEWSSRVKKRLDKIGKVDAPLRIGDFLPATDSTMTEYDLTSSLDAFAWAGIDLKAPPPVVEWCVQTQTSGSSRC